MMLNVQEDAESNVLEDAGRCCKMLQSACYVMAADNSFADCEVLELL